MALLHSRLNLNLPQREGDKRESNQYKCRERLSTGNIDGRGRGKKTKLLPSSGQVLGRPSHIQMTGLQEREKSAGGLSSRHCGPWRGGRSAEMSPRSWIVVIAVAAAVPGVEGDGRGWGSGILPLSSTAWRVYRSSSWRSIISFAGHYMLRHGVEVDASR